MNFVAKVTLTLEWFDTRLSYRNLLDFERPNIVKEEKPQVKIEKAING